MNLRKKIKIKPKKKNKKKLPIKVIELSDEEILKNKIKVSKSTKPKPEFRGMSPETRDPEIRLEYTAPQLSEMDERIRNLERSVRSGDPSAREQLSIEKTRSQSFTLHITKIPGSNYYNLSREDDLQEIGASPVLINIPLSDQEKAKKITEKLNRGVCPLDCYGTPECPMCNSVQSATEIHQLMSTGELYDLPEIPAQFLKSPPNWEEIKNHSWVDDDTNLL